MLNKYKKYLIPLLVILQFVWIIGNVFVFEVNLVTGKTVKLKIVPVDPRSLMQGDYVVLNYAINRIDHYSPSPWERKVRVVISPDENGVYTVKSIYDRNISLDEDDVVINGKPRGGRILYGIENYFVPEGTGTEVERAAHYGLVNVSSWGDAMLVKLLDK